MLRLPPGQDRERGGVLVETAFLLVLLTAPVLLLVGTVARVQAGAYAVTAAVREAGRGYATADSPDDAGLRAETAAGVVLASHGFGLEDATLTVGCDTRPCLSPGNQVSVQGELRVPLLLVPDFARDVLPGHVTVTASHLEVVDEYRSLP
ncbi:pilus assembly protein [Ornithinicoccus halotolerans]|uniref:pilus assembly protein n=1 Tax=Ornithinicoccus halotolerans TaxID=1748220 RepID=UPI001297976A|nr:pilus assembly protein [Ornithinicoccus halotolerans]